MFGREVVKENGEDEVERIWEKREKVKVWNDVSNEVG